MDLSLVKTWVQSKTIWASIVGAAGGIAALTGHALSPDDAQTALAGIMSIVQSVGTIASVAASLVAIYGRVVATHKIVAKPPQ